VTLRATDASGLSGLATADVSVTAPPTAVPLAPTSLRATAADGSVTLNWSEPATGGATYFVIRDASGTIVDAVSAAADGSAPTGWQDTALTNGTAYSYMVTAGAW
jgi:hypothetical protein